MLIKLRPRLMACTNGAIDQITLSPDELKRRMEIFRRTAFKLFSRPPATSTEQMPSQVIHVIRSMMTLTNEVLKSHNSSAVLTRIEEDANLGTQVYVRIACTNEAQEQVLIQTLVDHIKQQACLLRPEIVESQLDGTSEVRMRVPSAKYAETLAWNTQRDQLRKPFIVALGLGSVLISFVAYLYHVEHTPHDGL